MLDNLILSLHRDPLDFLVWKVTLDGRERRQDIITMLISNAFIVYFSYLLMCLIWSLHSKQTSGPIASIFVHSLPVRWRKGRLCEELSRSDLMPWMNMYKSNNIIFVMVIGLMPACSSQKQMVISLPSSRCRDRPPLLNMMTTINTLIIYRQK